MGGGSLGREMLGHSVRHHVCFVVGQLLLGGLERQVYLLARGLDPKEFEVTVISLSEGGAWSPALAEAGIRVIHLRRRGRLDWLRLADLTRVFRRIRPDLVYSFQYAPNAYARLAGLLASVPILITGERGIYLRWWQGVLERLLGRVTECVVCNTDTIREDLVERIGLPRTKVVTVRNAAEVPPLVRDEERRAIRNALGIGDDGCVVGTIARLEKVKNLPMLIEVADLCRSSGGWMRFIVVGGGSQAEALRRIVRRRRLEETVLLVGESESARDLLPALDVFVLTSRSEGLPNTVMEAMAAGLPCVCTDVGGCRELVVPGVTGYLVPSGAAAAMARILLDLAGSRARRETLGRRGRARIAEQFPVRRMIADTERLLRSLLAVKDVSLRGRRIEMAASR
ncbi:MAG: glycosyltransferase [Acidobacteriota bacterium]